MIGVVMPNQRLKRSAQLFGSGKRFRYGRPLNASYCWASKDR